MNLSAWLPQGNLYNVGLVDSNGVIPLELGGTGAKTASSALSNLGALGLSGGTLTNALNLVVPSLTKSQEEIMAPMHSQQCCL